LRHVPPQSVASATEDLPLKVWDVPTRLAHWAIVLLFGVSWLTAEQGWITWHRLSGSSMLCVVLFRLFWGVWGSDTARFAQFVRGPRKVGAYVGRLLRGKKGPAGLGHNPLGAWSVVAMLGLLLLQAGLGLFAVDEYGIEGGPLAQHLSFEGARQVAAIHEAVFDLLLVVVALHACAVVAHLVIGGDNLVGPMITGRRRAGPGPAQPPAMAPSGRAAVGFVAIAAAVAALAFFG